MKVVISLMVSTGCRIGAIPDLKYSALKYIEKYHLYEVIFYEREQEEYFGFTTPECAQYINQYLEYRKRGGESLHNNSPLIRNDFVMGDLRAKTPKKLAKGTLSDRLRNILIKTGLRIPSPTNERKEVALNHGFRKYFDTVCIDNDVNLISKELLMGHSVGLDENYYRPIINKKALTEYLKVVDELTIDPVNILKKENSELKEGLQIRIQELEGSVHVYRTREREREEEDRKHLEWLVRLEKRYNELNVKLDNLNNTKKNEIKLEREFETETDPDIKDQKFDKMLEAKRETQNKNSELKRSLDVAIKEALKE